MSAERAIRKRKTEGYTIRVIDSVPVFIRGLADALGTCPDISRVLVGDAPQSLAGESLTHVVTVRATPDLQLLNNLRRRSSSAGILVLLAGRIPVRSSEVAAFGASSVMHWDADVHDIVRATLLTCRGLRVFPSGQAGELAVKSDNELDPQCLTWLRMLTAGSTVRQIADKAGYSMRTMYRRLDQLYTVLGVDGRSAAIVWAARHGVIDRAVDPLGPPRF